MLSALAHTTRDFLLKLFLLPEIINKIVYGKGSSKIAYGKGSHHLDMNSIFQYVPHYISQRSLIDDILLEKCALNNSSLKPVPILLLAITANKKLCKLLTKTVE